MKKKKENKKKFSFKEEYNKSFLYLKESRKFIYSVIAVFFVAFLIGFFVPASDNIVEEILKYISELIEKTDGMSQGELIRFIFLNNLQASFFGMMFGFLLGIFPVFASLANGYLLGFVASMTVSEAGISILWRLFPHGIFELPAVFISLGLGVRFGTFIFKRKKLESFKIYLWNSLRVFIFVVIPLLIVAAIIEGMLIFIL